MQNVFKSKRTGLLLGSVMAICSVYGACQVGKSSLNSESNRDNIDNKSGVTQLEQKLSKDFKGRYAEWMQRLPQRGNDNVLALAKVSYSEKLGFALLERLRGTLPSLKPSVSRTAAVNESRQPLNDAIERVETRMASLADRMAQSSGPSSAASAASAPSELVGANSVSETLASLEQIDAAEQAQTILEFLANSPQSDEVMRELRADIIKLLGESPRSNEFTIQTLNLIARGVNLSLKNEAAASYEVYLANESIRNIISRKKKTYVAPFQASSHRFGKETEKLAKSILGAEILSIRSLSENAGVNDSVIVTMKFKDETTERFLFKSAAGSKSFSDKYYDKSPNDFLNFINYTREARAANFFHLILDNMPKADSQSADVFVPLTLEVALYHDGISYGMGSLQRFVDSSYIDIVEHQNGHRREWQNTISKMREWQEAVVVVKVLDFTFGNIDRLIVPGVKNDYDKNLMVKFFDPNAAAADETAAQGLRPWSPLGVALIDNGLGLPGRDWYTIDKLVSAKDMPAGLKEAFRSQQDKVDALLASEVDYFVDWGLRDFAKRYDQVLKRMGQ
jgi:hypothetical protein